MRSLSIPFSEPKLKKSPSTFNLIVFLLPFGLDSSGRHPNNDRVDLFTTSQITSIKPWSETLAKRCVWQPLNPISRMSILHLLLTIVEAPKKKNTIEWKQNSIWEYLYRNLPFVPKRNCLCFLSPASSFIEPIFVAQQAFPKTAALISVTEISWVGSNSLRLQFFGDLKDKFLFTWDQTQCTKTGFMCVWNKNKPVFLKELKYIWEKYENYSASNTLLISDPEKALLNPPYTAIFPKRHDFNDEDDDFLVIKK